MVKLAHESRAAPKKPGAQSAEHRRQYPRADLQVKAKLSLADDPSHNFEASLPTGSKARTWWKGARRIFGGADDTAPITLLDSLLVHRSTGS